MNTKFKALGLVLLTGYYLRFKMVYSSTGTIPPTVKAVGRND